MYVPRTFVAPNVLAVEKYLRSNTFATLVVNRKNTLTASHIPLILDKRAESLFGHIAIANPLKECLSENEEMLAIFMNTHAYISSSWYEKINVPTWNYIAIHVYGRPEIMTGDELYDSLGLLVDLHEDGRPARFNMEDMPEEFKKAHLEGIVGFRLSIDRVEAAFKLSQNRNSKDFDEIIKRLEKEEDPLSRYIAEEMKNLKA